MLAKSCRLCRGWGLSTSRPDYLEWERQLDFAAKSFREGNPNPARLFKIKMENLQLRLKPCFNCIGEGWLEVHTQLANPPIQDGVYVVSSCRICHGMGVRGNPEKYSFWSRYFRRVFDRATASEEPNRAALKLAHCRLSRVLSQHAACSFCDGEGVTKKRLPEKLIQESPIQDLLDGGDGWLDWNNETAGG